MTGSPTAGLAPVDKALAVARALVAHAPEHLDERAELLAAPELPPGWRRHVRASGTAWYVLVREDGSGASARELPPGEALVGEVRLEDRRPMTRWLLDAVRALEEGRAEPGRPMAEEDLGRLHLALGVCAGDGDASFLPAKRAETDLMTAIRAVAEGRPPALAWWQELLERRALLGASGMLVGEVGLAVEVTATIEAPADAGRAWAPFHGPAGADRRELVEHVCSAPIRNGRPEALLALLDELRDRADRQVEAGLAAATYDEHLQALFDAIPSLHAALCLARLALSAGPELVGDRAVKRLRGAERVIDERLVRCTDAFAVQLTDLGGGRWAGHHAEVARVRAAHGEDAARARAERFADEQLLYPRALVPALLAPEPTAV